MANINNDSRAAEEALLRALQDSGDLPRDARLYHNPHRGNAEAMRNAMRSVSVQQASASMRALGEALTGRTDFGSLRREEFTEALNRHMGYDPAAEGSEFTASVSHASMANRMGRLTMTTSERTPARGQSRTPLRINARLGNSGRGITLEAPDSYGMVEVDAGARVYHIALEATTRNVLVDRDLATRATRVGYQIDVNARIPDELLHGLSYSPSRNPAVHSEDMLEHILVMVNETVQQMLSPPDNAPVTDNTPAVPVTKLGAEGTPVALSIMFKKAIDFHVPKSVTVDKSEVEKRLSAAVKRALEAESAAIIRDASGPAQPKRKVEV